MNNDLKNIISKNELTFGSWITLGHTSIPEILAQAGFEWLVIDIEHSVIDIQKVQELIQIIDLKGLTPLVRLTSNDSALIKRVMDAGAYGVIVPMVNNKDDAKKAVNAVKYPPVGIRGVGLARAQGYGTAFDEYKSWINESSIIIVQIEHVDAVNNIDEIFSIPEIDGYIIGPYDLSASIGLAGDLHNSRILELEKKVMEAAQAHNKIAGLHVVEPDVKIALKYINMGYKFIAVSLDILYLAHACIKTMEGIRKEIGDVGK